jgi:hypothetical protein
MAHATPRWGEATYSPPLVASTIADAYRVMLTQRATATRPPIGPSQSST